MRRTEFLKFTSILLLAGISLISIVLLVPNAAGDPAQGCFIKIAVAHSWGRLFDPTAAWCSLKLILFSLGLFLVIETLGTILWALQHRNSAWVIYSLHVVPCFGVLLGGYCLLKALV